MKNVFRFLRKKQNKANKKTSTVEPGSFYRAKHIAFDLSVDKNRAKARLIRSLETFILNKKKRKRKPRVSFSPSREKRKR